MIDESKFIIQTQALCRHFGTTQAVESLDLSILEGEIFGLVGPDGAGKTTTIRLLAGLLNISSGSATVAGFDLRRKAETIKPRIGYMAQQFSLYGDLSVDENLAFFADIYSVYGEVRRQRTERLLQFAKLTEFRQRRAVHLSGGMQKKLALACTLIHQPEVLLLDEPTTGVDPVSRREFWDILAELHHGGTTILISTPYMDEAERCQRVGLLYEGRLMMVDQPRRIRELTAGELIEFHVDDWQMTRTLLVGLEGVLEVQTYGDVMRIFLDSAEKRLPALENLLRANNIAYRGLRRRLAGMEEAFVSLIRRVEA
ncbi:MAG: ABC transporter ATP-binding protein [Anaerolineales bacterium]|jgi:ABC-2 type transport system ATP-binding protein